MIWGVIAIAIINMICGVVLIIMYIRKEEECRRLKIELKTIYTQVNQGTLKEWMSKTEDEAWRDL